MKRDQKVICPDSGSARRFRIAAIGVLLLGITANAHGQEGSGILDSDRPRISGPLALQTALDTAMRYNLGLQAKRFEAAATSEELRAARTMARPQLSANTFLSSGDMPNILGTPPGSLPSAALTVPPKRFIDQNLTLMVPLYTGGRLGNQVKAVSQRENAAKAEVSAGEADALLMVKEAYYRAQLAGELVKVAQARRDASSELVSVTRAQLEAGKSIRASVTRAGAELADAERMLTSARNDQAKALLELKRVMGVQLDSDIALIDALTMSPPDGDLAGDLAEASRSRPEILAARARLQSTTAQLGAAKGAYLPQVYGAAMADAFSRTDMDKRVGATLGIIVSFPIFDSGQRSAEVRQMDAMRRRDEAEVKDMELRVAMEVRQARLDLDTAEANYRAAEAVTQSSREAYDVMVLRVENQRSILVEQLDALAALTQARANLAQALFDHSIAVAGLRRAIGRP
jgi:outer membrane protein TolC